MRIEVGTYESKLVAPPAVISQLRKLMKTRVEGYKYTEAYKKYGWDGTTYHISKKGVFLSGLVDYVYKICNKYYGDRIKIIPYHYKEFEVEELDLEVGNGWTLTKDQEKVVRKILTHTYADGTPCIHGVIDAAVNAGKTSIFASLIRNYRKGKFIILCDRTLVFKKTVKFFYDIYGEDEIGLIQGKTVRLKRITVAMVQSLKNVIDKNKSIHTYFDFLIGDECHNLSNDRGSYILKRIQAPYRYFFSGTPYDHKNTQDKVHITGLTGYPIARITNKHNQKTGVSLQGIVKLHYIPYPPGLNGKEYLKYLQHNPARNKRIADIVTKNKGKKILIVCKFIEHCEEILSYLPEGVYYTNGQDDNKDHVIKKFTKDPSGVLLTTFIIKEGVNIPDIQVLISAFGGADEISTKQVAGRAIRVDGVSDTVDIHDFYDDGGNLKDHSEKRITFYEKEGYKIKKLWGKN